MDNEFVEEAKEKVETILPFEEQIKRVGYNELIELIDKVEEGSSISIVLYPDMGEQAFVFAVGLEKRSKETDKKRAKIACVRKLHYAHLLEVELTGDSNGKAVFRRIKSYMQSIGIKINRYSNQFAVDVETYNKLNGGSNE